MDLGHHLYVPILLTKRGERTALGLLGADDKAQMTPLFVVAPVDWNFDADEPAKTVDSHLRTLGKDLATCWGTKPAFLDLQFIDGRTLMADGSHPLTWLTGQANQEGAQLVPAVSIGRDAVYLQAAADVIARDGRGACIRLGPADWPSGAGLGPLSQLLDLLGVRPGDTDLVLDLAEEVVSASGLSLTAVRNALTLLPHVHDWRSVTIAGASFPKQLSELDRGLTIVERLEWNLYRSLLSGPQVPRVPAFGDYAIAHPDPIIDVNPRLMNISAAIRYTIEDAWLIAKGALFKGSGGQGQGAAAVPPLASAIVNDHRFAGADHCAGDEWLARIASNQSGGGNPEAWRRFGTVHHLTHVARAIASLP